MSEIFHILPWRLGIIIGLKQEVKASHLPLSWVSRPKYNHTQLQMFLVFAQNNVVYNHGDIVQMLDRLMHIIMSTALQCYVYQIL